MWTIFSRAPREVGQHGEIFPGLHNLSIGSPPKKGFVLSGRVEALELLDNRKRPLQTFILSYYILLFLNFAGRRANKPTYNNIYSE